MLVAVAACNRLEPASPDPGLDFSDPDVGGGVGIDDGPETPIPTAAPTNEASPRLDATAEALATFPPVTTTPAALPVDTPAPVETPLETPPPPATEATPAPSATPEEAGLIVHTVQPGETLFHIGLQYGLSWVVIAEFNGILNPDAIDVGQEIRIPPTPTPTAEARSIAPIVAERSGRSVD